MKILTKENTRGNLEDRITYILSEWLNDASPLGQDRYREPAKAVIKEIKNWKPATAREHGRRSTRRK